MAFGYVPTAVMKPLLAIASSWPQVLGIRLIERAGKGVRTAPRDALISDTTPDYCRGAAFGLHRAMDSAGAIIGTVISFLLIIFALSSSDADTMRTLFILSAIPAAGSVALVLLFVREKRPPRTIEALQKKGFFDSLRGLDPVLKRFLLVMSLIGFANAGYAFFILRAQSDPIGASLSDILLLYIAMNITYTVFSIPAGHISDRIGRKPMIASGLIVFIVAALVMGFADSISLVLVGFLLYGTFLAIGEVNQRAFVSELAIRGERGTALGAYHTVIGITALPAGILFGSLWDVFGPLQAFAFGAIVALLAIIFLYSFVSSKRADKEFK